MIYLGNRRLPALVLLLFLAALFLLPHAFVTSAQKQRPAKPKPAKASPSPTPGPFDGLGAPPPVPTLKKEKEQEVTPGDVISVNTTEVMIPVTVRDASGRLVSELTRKDFRRSQEHTS